MRILTAAAFAALLGAPALAQQAPSCAPADLAEAREEFAKDFTKFRRAQGLPELEANPAVQAAAQAFACTIVEMGRLSHEAPDGARAGHRLWRQNYDWCRVGENLAVGQRDAEAALEAWRTSPPHRHNMGLDDVAHFGLGLAYADPDDFPQFDSTRKGSPVWVMVVARLCP